MVIFAGQQLFFENAFATGSAMQLYPWTLPSRRLLILKCFQIRRRNLERDQAGWRHVSGDIGCPSEFVLYLLVSEL